MSNIIDFSSAVNAAIQAGEVVDGNVVRIITDNGTNIGNAVAQDIAAGGGAGATIYTLTQTGAGGAQVATGISLLALELPTVVAAIAPCLGVAAGFGLYNLAPEFWTNLSNALIESGETVFGQCLAYWDGELTYFSEQTIEIVKNALVDLGAFDTGVPSIPPYQDTGSITITGRLTPSELLEFVKVNERVIDYSAIISNINAFIAQRWTPNKICELTLYRGNSAFSGEGAFSLSISYNDYPDNSSVSLGGGYFHTLIASAGNTPAGAGITLTSSRVVYGFTSLFAGKHVTSDTNQYSNINGVVTTASSFPLQEGATYPDSRPFYQIYTDWSLHQYPQTLPNPEELPKIYPAKYPDIDPNPYPSQEDAQNPNPEIAPTIYPVILPNFDININAQVETQPEPDPDPDPQPDPDQITDPTTETPTPPDPFDPNPNPEITPVIPVPNLPDTVASNKLFTVYNPTAAQLDALGGYLWDGSIIAAIRDIWQEPLDGLISLIQVFVTPTTGGNHNIILGFLDSGVSSAVVSNQFVTVDCGSVTIDENKQNATDYAPYTSIHLYLPFIGFVELDTNEVMNSTISVKYKVDVYTGTCLASVSVDRTADMPNDPILYTYSGNCSQQIPLTSGNATGMLSALIGGITAGLSVASGGGLGIMAGAQILGNSLTHDMFHVNHSGNLSANAGIMGQKKPYVIIGRRHGYDANNYSRFYGYPVNKTVVLGNHTGFTQVKKCLLQTKATKPEYDEIMSLLENGVIL